MNIYRTLVSLMLLMISANGFAGSVQVGAVYPIAEPDALEEIKAKAQITNWSKALSKAKKAKLLSVHLPRVTEDKVRNHVPWYSLLQALTDKSGHVLYPKGFTFNPLAYVSMPMRLIVTDAKYLTALKDNIKETDIILLTEGEVASVRSKLGQSVFILTQQVRERFGLTHQPTIIQQVEEHLELHEILVKEEDLS